MTVKKANWLRNKSKKPNPNNKGVVLAEDNPRVLTAEQFARVLPPKFSGSLTPELMDKINGYLQQPDSLENLRENIIGYTSVLQEGRYKINDYLNAVRYVSLKLLGDTNITAYSKTFPDRYQRLVESGASSDKISSYSTAYNKNKLVVAIFGQSMMPTHIVNADIYQQAINHNLWLMKNAFSETVQQKAADSLMVQLAPPVENKIELEISNKDSEAMTSMKNLVSELAKKELKLIEDSTVSVQQVAEREIIMAPVAED